MQIFLKIWGKNQREVVRRVALVVGRVASEEAGGRVQAWGWRGSSASKCEKNRAMLYVKDKGVKWASKDARSCLDAKV